LVNCLVKKCDIGYFKGRGP